MGNNIWLLTALRRAVGTGRYPGQFVLADRLGRVLAKVVNPVVGEVDGYQVELDLGDELQRQVFFGIYDETLTAFLKGRLKPGSVFYDIGANIGYFTLLASRLVGNSGAVHAFEPIPSNVASILRNIERNTIQNVSVNESAVSDAPGTLTLFVSDSPRSSGWASVVRSDRRTNQLDVETVTIDDYIDQQGNPPPNLLKIDIEGAEPRALAGMKKLLTQDPGPDLVVEINPFLLERETLTQDAIAGPLIDAGYYLFVLGREGLTPFDHSRPAAHLIDIFASKRPTPTLGA